MEEPKLDLEERGQMKIIFPYGKEDVLDIDSFKGEIDNRTECMMDVNLGGLPIATKVEDIGNVN
jgi:hypothetical protein